MSKKRRLLKEEKTIKESEENKQTEFVSIAQSRIEKITRGIDSLGKLSERNNYKYTSEQVNEMFEYIENECTKCKKKFTENERNNYFKFKEH